MKETINKMNRQFTQSKLFVMICLLTDQYPKHTKNSYNLISIKQITQLENGQETCIAFFQVRYTDGQQEHGKMFNILSKRDILTKIAMRYYFMPIRMAIIKRQVVQVEMRML